MKLVHVTKPIERPAGEALMLAALEYEPALRALLWRYTRNNADVAELLQDVYARLLTRSSLIPIRSVRAHALIVARNTASDWLRHRKVVPIELIADVDELNVLDEHALVEHLINTQLELRILANAVMLLPPRCRQVFVLRKVYGYSPPEICKRLKISVNTVEQHLGQASRKLTALLVVAVQIQKE